MRRRRQNGTGGERTFTVNKTTPITTVTTTLSNSTATSEEIRKMKRRQYQQKRRQSVAANNKSDSAERKSNFIWCQENNASNCFWKFGHNECYGGHYSLGCFLGQQQQSKPFYWLRFPWPPQYWHPAVLQEM